MNSLWDLTGDLKIFVSNSNCLSVHCTACACACVAPKTRKQTLPMLTPQLGTRLEKITFGQYLSSKLSCRLLILWLPRAGLAAVRPAVLQAEGLGKAGHLLLQVSAECCPHLPEGWVPPGQLQWLPPPYLAALQVPLETNNPYKRADIKLVMNLAQCSK